MRYRFWNRTELPQPRQMTFWNLEVDGGYVDVADVKVTIEFTDNRGARIEFTGMAEGARIKTINAFTQTVHDGELRATAEPISFGLAEFESEPGSFYWRYA